MSLNLTARIAELAEQKAREEKAAALANYRQAVKKLAAGDPSDATLLAAAAAAEAVGRPLSRCEADAQALASLPTLRKAVSELPTNAELDEQRAELVRQLGQLHGELFVAQHPRKPAGTRLWDAVQADIDKLNFELNMVGTAGVDLRRQLKQAEAVVRELGLDV